MAAIQINEYNYAKLFIRDNRYGTGTYTDSGSGSTLLKGMLIGRVAATGKVKQCVSTATDGSQVPIGVLIDDYTVTASADQTLTYCVQGDVAADLLVFSSSPADTLSTVISLTDSGSSTVKIGTIGDILRDKGILPISGTELTAYDNHN